jgi:hypothetical protein
MATILIVWSTFLMSVSSYSIALPLLSSISRYFRHTPQARVIFYFLLVSTIAELYTGYLADQGVENTDLITIWVMIETLFLCWVFDKTIKGRWRFFLNAVLVVMLVLGLLQLLLWMESDRFASLMRITQSGSFIILSLVYYYQLFGRLEVKNLGKDPMFWFVTAFFMYFAGNLFFFIATGIYGGDLSEDDIVILLRIFTVNSLILILRNIIIAIGYWKIPTK